PAAVLNVDKKPPIALLAHTSAVGEVSRSNQEQRRPPRAPAIDAVTRRTEPVVESRFAWRPRGGPVGVEQPSQAPREHTDDREGRGEGEERAARRHESDRP